MLSWISTFYLDNMALPLLLGICVLIGQFFFASSLLIGQLRHGPCITGVPRFCHWSLGKFLVLNEISSIHSSALRGGGHAQCYMKSVKPSFQERRPGACKRWSQWKHVFYRCPCQYEFPSYVNCNMEWCIAADRATSRLLRSPNNAFQIAYGVCRPAPPFLLSETRCGLGCPRFQLLLTS